MRDGTYKLTNDFEAANCWSQRKIVRDINFRPANSTLPDVVRKPAILGICRPPQKGGNMSLLADAICWWENDLSSDDRNRLLPMSWSDVGDNTDSGIKKRHKRLLDMFRRRLKAMENRQAIAQQPHAVRAEGAHAGSGTSA